MAEATDKAKLIFKAVNFAAAAHSQQYRKGTELPYLLHPLGVAKILIQSGAGEEIVAAGILHDTIEDTGVTLSEIEREFGPTVKNLVQAVSERDRSDTWENRKKETVAHVKTLSLPALLVEAADKLDNIRAIREDCERLGDKVWERFNRPREQQSWYYRGLARAFLEREVSGAAGEIIREFAREVERVFGTE